MAACAGVLFGPAAAGAALPAGVSFTYTGGEQVYVVPVGVASVAVTAIGAAGGEACGTPSGGGLGAAESADLTVYGGQKLYIEVGGVGQAASDSICGPTPAGGAGGFGGGGSGGTDANNGDGGGGGGGGASDVRTVSMAGGPYASLGSRAIVAAGGGGAGAFGPGFGGAADSVAGGGSSLGSNAGGGGGASEGTGGAGGTGDSPGAVGLFGAGGTGASSECSGAGGGGGGYWGGGGGGGGGSTTCDVSGGGGGGSSFANGDGVANGTAPTASTAAAGVSIVPLSEATSSLSTHTLTFSPAAVNTISGAQTATFTDTGTATLTHVSAAITGADASDYLVTNNTCTATVAAQSSCAVTIRFAPQALGARSASLQFESASGSSPDAVALSGTGAPSSSFGTTPLTAPAVVGSNAFAYPYVEIGHGSTIVVIAYLHGAGDFDVHVSSVDVATHASAPVPRRDRQTFAVLHTSMANRGRVVLELHPTYEGRQLVRRDARLHKRFRVTVEATFTPTGGAPNHKRRTFRITPRW